ncbi:surface-adhesin E family protein [Paraburkholderia bannensis]|uniref:surface-adhesin E family protein n=1 Tax=Paraburkholderia bannensis TaxID=765414 RepID=UPI002AB7B812|nr:surface-adhesin E family protein [Paraburkholderia bannensis]
MKRKWLAGASLALATSGAFAANWTALENDDLLNVSIDPSSLVRHKDHTQVEVKVVYADPQPYPSHSFPVKSQVSLWTFDCAHQTWSMGQTTTYGPHSGQVEVTPEYPNIYDDVPPDSMQNLVMEHVCGKA